VVEVLEVAEVDLPSVETLPSDDLEIVDRADVLQTDDFFWSFLSFFSLVFFFSSLSKPLRAAIRFELSNFIIPVQEDLDS